MKRKDLLNKLDINILISAKYRVFIDTDYKNEADDPYALIHFLLSPTIDIVGIGATHFYKKRSDIDSMSESNNGIKELFDLMKLEDVNFYKCSPKPLDDSLNYIDNEASDKIIEEAKKGLLYVALQGACINLAIALLKDKSIAKNIIVLFNGGGPYPYGRAEFYVMQDIIASNIIFKTSREIYQVNQDVYSTIEVSISKLKYKLKNLGKVGNYLYKFIEEENLKVYNPNFFLKSGECWTLGENSLIGILLMNRYKLNYKIINRRLFDENGLYKEESNLKVRVYESIDYRFIIEDLF